MTLFFRYAVLIVGCLSSIICLNAMADTLIPYPAETTIEKTNLHVTDNTHQTIYSLRTALSHSVIAEFYRKTWALPNAQGVPGFIETRKKEIGDSPDSIIITRYEGEHTIELHLIPNKAPYIVVEPIQNVRHTHLDFAPTAPTPPNGMLTSHLVNDHGYNKGNIRWFQSRDSITQVMDFYENHFRRQGWTLRSNTSPFDQTSAATLQAYSEDNAIMIRAHTYNGMTYVAAITRTP